MDQGRFVTQTNRFHDDWSQCFISGRYTFPFSFILLVSVCCWQTSAGSCHFYFYFSVCLSPLHLFSSTLTNYPSPALWHGRASIPSRMSFFPNKIFPWAVFLVFVRFDIILVWSFISRLSSMFSFCSANINASSTSSSLKVPFPSPVIFCFLFFLFACEPFWRGWPLATSCWTTCITSWWSWAALQLAFMNLWTVKMSTIFWWTAVNVHTYTFVLYWSGIWLAPSAGVVCSGLRCREHYLFFLLKGLLRFLYQAATSVIAHMLLRLFSL